MNPQTLPQTDIPHVARLSSRLAAAVLLLVMLAGIIQLSLALRQLHDLPHSNDDILRGRTSLALEKQLNAQLPAREPMIATANGLRYLLLRGASAQVQLGHDDWLFLNEELQTWPNGNANMQARLDLVAQVARKLAYDKVKLIVLLVPDKIRLYPNQSFWAHDDVLRYQAALRGLQARQVEVVDPLLALQTGSATSAVYYRSDTHWNQLGAKIAAEQVALRVQALARANGWQWERTEFAMSAKGSPAERAGDLLRLMGLEHSPNWLRPQPDLETQQVLQQLSADAATGLLDDVSIPVVLTGTSYSLRGQFHGYLQQFLHTKVLNAAKDGAGFVQATQAYLDDQAYQSAKPLCVIWEIPERFLQQPLEQERVWRDQLAKPRSN
jgi:alginate O-acetyltransferase complex protein AlgJ